MRSGLDLHRRHGRRHGCRPAYRHRRHRRAGHRGDPRGAPRDRRARQEGPDLAGLCRRHPQRRRRGKGPGAGRRCHRHRPLRDDGAQLQQAYRRRHRLSQRDRRRGGLLLPLPYGPLPGGRGHPGPGAAPAPRSRQGGRARLQLPAHADDGGPVAGARLRQDQHPFARAGGSRRAHHGSLGHVQGSAGRHQLCRRPRGVGAGGNYHKY